MNETRQAELFKALSVGTRIRIIDLLKERGPLGAGALSEALGITPSAVSQHLKALRYAGLVRGERKGYWLPYEIDRDALARCRDLLSEVCTCGCKGSGRVRDAEREGAKDPLSLLKRYERELTRELGKVRSKMKELETEK